MITKRVRFAPSPTGNLHLGSARTALFNWLFAKAQGGEFIIRIEDTDRKRSANEYEQAILGDLRWLGLDWDEGPVVGGPFGPYHQSQRQNIYQEMAQKLLREGKAYFCYCSAEELEESRQRALAEGRMPKYDGRCLRLAAREKKAIEEPGRRAVVRFKIPKRKIVIDDLIIGKVEFDSEVIGDFILLRSDGTASFNFANVIDDVLMEITHVIRGNDHLSNTPRHILLFEALEKEPPRFAHHSLLLGTDHTKMSKRHGATAVFEYREQGYLSRALMNYLALLSWSPGDDQEIFAPQGLIKKFSINGISKSPAIFDINKLRWINKQHISRTEPKALAMLATPFVETGDMWLEQPIKEPESTAFLDFIHKIEMVKDRLTTLQDVPEMLEMLFSDSIDLKDEAKIVLAEPSSRLVLESLIVILETTDELDEEKSKEILKALGQKLKAHNIKGKALFMPIRAALTGKTSGLELSSLLSGLGKEKSLTRMRSAAKNIVNT